MTETDFIKRTNHAKDGIIDFAAGSLGGVALVYVGQPLDTVKVKMQLFPTLYKGMTHCFSNVLKTDGIYKGLYAGTMPALICNVAENSILFLCYGFCQKLMQKITGASRIEELSAVSNATAGSLAALFSSLAICPTELIKCKLQAMHEMQTQAGGVKEKIGPTKLTLQIFRNEGVSGLFRGFVPTVVREMPGYFFFFGGYEGTRELFCQRGQAKEDIGLLKTMTAGAVGGALFWTSTYPVDVVKSRIQIMNSSENLIQVLIKIVRNEGFFTLYSGLKPTIVRTIPATAVLFVTYEYSKQFMHFLFKDC